MDEMNSDEKERITLQIINFISREINLLPMADTPPDLILNKGPYMLDSEQVHRILAQIADDTGFSMILLRRVFPYDRYFIMTQISICIQFGIFFFVFGILTFFIYKEINMYLFLLPLSFLLFARAFLKYLDTCFIRKGKPELTVALFTEIILSILNKHRNELAFGVQPHERQLWRHKIYEVLKRYPHIFPVEEFSPGFIVPLSDPDEYDMGLAVEECGAVMSLSFDMINQSEIYEKYTEYDEDELLTIVQFADILIDFWAEKKSKTLNENKLTPELSVNITDRMGYHE